MVCSFGRVLEFVNCRRRSETKEEKKNKHIISNETVNVKLLQFRKVYNKDVR